MSGDGTDSEILADIANSGAGTETTLQKAREVLGKDGYIVTGKYPGTTVYVAFSSDQFKNEDNRTPTNSKDVRYSVDDDTQEEEYVARGMKDFSIRKGDIREGKGVLSDIAASAQAGTLNSLRLGEDFEKLWNLGKVSSEIDPEYEAAAQSLKGRKIFVSDAVKGEFLDDWNSFRQQAMGYGLYFTNDQNDMGLDSVNAELADQIPGLFDATDMDSRNIAEHFLRVMRRAKASVISLDEDNKARYGAQYEQAKQADKDSFISRAMDLQRSYQDEKEAHVEELQAEFRKKQQERSDYIQSAEERRLASEAGRIRQTPKAQFEGSEAMQKLGIKIDGTLAQYGKEQSLRGYAEASREIDRELKKVEKRLRPTAAESEFANGIVAGLYSEEDIPKGMDHETVMELADYYMAQRSLGNDLIKQQRKDINASLQESMETLFKDREKGKSLPAVVLNNRTVSRSMRSMFGDELGGKVYDEIFRPVAVNEAERYRFQNRMMDQVRTFEGSDGKSSPLTKEERALVQQVIEGRAVGEMVAGSEMRSAIQNAASNIRKGEAVGDSAREFGLSDDERDLAAKYANWLNVQDELENGKSDAVKINRAAEKFSSMFNDFYDAINDFLVVHGYEPIGFIKGYAPHMQTEKSQNLLVKAMQSMGLNTDVTNLPASIAGLTADYKPNKRWNPYFLSRTSDVTDYDISSAFESYVSYMSDVLYHTDDIMRVRQAAQYFRKTYAPLEISERIGQAEQWRFGSKEDKARILREYGKIGNGTVLSQEDTDKAFDDFVSELYSDIKEDAKYSNFTMWLDNYGNSLAGKQSLADRGWEFSLGRRGLNIGNKLVRAFGRAQVAGNLSTVLNQTAQLPQIIAENGIINTSRAAADILTGKLKKTGFSNESDFLTGKAGVNYLVNTKADMVVTALFKPAEMMDGLMSQLAVRGRYIQELNQGATHEEAMRAADQFGDEVMASRMRGTRPAAFDAKNPVSQMVHVFQVEAINSWEHLSQDLPRDFREIEASSGKRAAALALAGVVAKALFASFLLNRVDDELYGGTPAPFDIFGLTSNFIASGEGLSTNGWLMKMVDNGMEQLTGDRPFGTDRNAGNETFDISSAGQDTLYNVLNDVPFARNITSLLGLGDETLPMPGASGAFTDFASALGKVVSGDENASGEEVAMSALKAASEFVPGGRQISKTAQGIQTMLKGGKTNGYGDSARLQYPVEGSPENWARAALFGNSGLSETESFYASGESGLSSKQTQLYHSMTGAGADGDMVYSTILDVRNAKDEDSYTEGIMKRAAIERADLSDQEKAELFSGLISDTYDEKFQTMMKTGMSWSDVMEAYNKRAELNHDDSLSAQEKATQFAAWSDQTYGSTQSSAVKDNLTFSGGFVVSADSYEKYADAGLSTKNAEDLSLKLAGLEPESGESTVSSLQKYKAVLSEGLSERETRAAMRVVMSDAEYQRLSLGADYDVTCRQYVSVKEVLDRIDDNGNVSQKEAETAIDSLSGLSKQQKAALWQLQNKSWKSKNNPYSVSVGEQVYVDLHDGALTLPE